MSNANPFADSNCTDRHCAATEYPLIIQIVVDCTRTPSFAAKLDDKSGEGDKGHPVSGCPPELDLVVITSRFAPPY